MDSQLQELLHLKSAPVALCFQATAPEGIARVDGSRVSSCAYWKLAAEGHTFYTEASDHYGCPIGAHTHGVELPEETAKELQGLVEVMVGLEYVRMEEVPAIPHRTTPFRVAVYAPLADASFDPDVVLVRGDARQIMLLNEAAVAADLGPDGGVMGRPTCAAIPYAIDGGRGAASLGCIGNRVYTGLSDDELYFAIPGPQLPAIEARLRTILHANRELEQFHRGRLENAAATA